MKELNNCELEIVSGCGVITDSLNIIGGDIGDFGYKLVSNTLSVSLPIIGNVSIGSVFPELGRTVGGAIGTVLGDNIESRLASLPYIGGAINKLLGN